MSLEVKIAALITAVGGDVKSLTNKIGDLTGLTTTQKATLVGAINEVKTAVTTLQAGSTAINDTAGNGDVNVTWSANKIHDEIVAAAAALKNDILGGAGAALDTLKELADALAGDANYATTIAAKLAKVVAVDVIQTFTNAEKIQARANIGAAAATDLAQLQTDLGNVDADLVALYSAAKV
jgi:hypothetical protein